MDTQHCMYLQHQNPPTPRDCQKQGIAPEAKVTLAFLGGYYLNVKYHHTAVAKSSPSACGATLALGLLEEATEWAKPSGSGLEVRMGPQGYLRSPGKGPCWR